MSTRVLNVNDSPSNRYYVTRVLQSAGFEVVEASTGAEGLAVARRDRPSVVVLDIKLPDMSGLEVACMLRADPATAGMIIIQTSATFVTSEGKVRGLESGADQYLTQPFESVELVAMVRNLLRLRDKEIESHEKAAALVQADRRKDEFLAMLAHELRNPLSAIATAAALLEGGATDERTAKLSATVTRQTRHLARLVDDLLDVSRITRGKIELRTERIELGALVRRLVDSELGTLARHHDVHVDVADDAMWIDGDPTRIEQIVANLVGNASKYTASGGHIHITLSPTTKGSAQLVVLDVKDDGIGIDSDHQGAVFDLFYQVDHSLAHSQGGLGIGLTMVKRLVEMHGGIITVASEGVGKGALFRVELPAAAPPATSVSKRVSEAPPMSLRALVIDDNVDSCELLAMGLELEGHTVQTANDGADGLELALTLPYDVALVDIGLPRVDGYTIARRVRAERPGASPVLIAVSGYGRDEDRARVLEAGFDTLLVKPVELSILLETVITCVRARRAGEAKRSA